MAVNVKKYSISFLVCTLFVAQWVLFANTRPIPQQPPTEISDSVIISGDTTILILEDTLALDSSGVPIIDSLAIDTLATKESFLDDVLTGQSKDSLFYDVKNGKVYSYKEADITYQQFNMKADYLEMDMPTKIIYAYGMPDDSTGNPTRPIFKEGETEYTMDTITYNITTKKAKIKGILTHEGEGILRGGLVKKMSDNTINIAGGKYSTCDADHPHFYINMSKAKVLPGKKAVFGPSYFVMEDVPLYFLGLPFGFFPLSKDRSSGFIMPTFGEQALKGFFLRDGGYYYAPNDYVDATITGGIYTMGSWEVAATSRYTKRYKFNGNVNLNYSKEVFGDKGSADFGNMSNFRVQWSHSQDPKFRPNSTFAASVNFSTSGYNKYSSNNLNDYITAQTNSSISYSKNWAGKPFSFSTNMNHSQSSRDTTVSLGFPNFTFNVSRIYPFKRHDAIGKERWYEKVALSYNTTFSNSVTVKEKNLFKDKMFKSMRNGMNHTIPISTSLSLFNYINITPSMNYQERWYFDKIKKEWNPETNNVEVTDTTRGFYRLYNYSYSASATTRVYGMFQFGKNSAIQAIRHVMTPNIGFSYTPDFGQSKFGYYESIQTDSTGRVGYYSPYERGMYGVPGRGRSASLSFGLSNTLEMKVRSKKDSTGVKKLSILDNLSANGSYNFLADSMNLSMISVNLRSSIIKDFGINLSMMFDPYQVNSKGQRINKFLVEKGQLARLVSVGTSFSYNFSGGSGAPSNAINSGNNGAFDPGQDPYLTNDYGADQPIDPNLRRLKMSSLYYDFNIPYNIGFNYSINYNNNGIRKQITQTAGFNASMNITPKWAVTFNGGYDFEAKKLTPGQFVLTRDLHCWQMNFSWIPIGFMQSWSFNISVKSSMLKDLKYDKSSSFYDNFYDK